MKMSPTYLLLFALVMIVHTHAAELQPHRMSQAAMTADPIVGTYDCTRYGTTFEFHPDGTLIGADGLGDGTWQATDSAHHIYIVKIRPSKMDSPDRYESWTLALDNAGLTQNAGQSIVCSRMK
jgi:hypothetical protein